MAFELDRLTRATGGNGHRVAMEDEGGSRVRTEWRGEKGHPFFLTHPSEVHRRMSQVERRDSPILLILATRPSASALCSCACAADVRCGAWVFRDPAKTTLHPGCMLKGHGNVQNRCVYPASIRLQPSRAPPARYCRHPRRRPLPAHRRRPFLPGREADHRRTGTHGRKAV